MLNASRFDQRKRIDLTVEGFARFAAGKPANVRLCLHHAILGDAETDQITALIARFGLQARVHLNPLAGGVVGDRDLNLLYNACDAGINTSMGEGWGLVSVEHGAAGAAQIVPDHSACAELWNGRAEMIPPARRIIPEFSSLQLAEVLRRRRGAGAGKSLSRSAALPAAGAGGVRGGAQSGVFVGCDRGKI